MVLMKPGCWHDTVWADRSWPADQWLEYEAAVLGGDSSAYYYLKKRSERKSPRELLITVKKLLTTIRGY